MVLQVIEFQESLEMQVEVLPLIVVGKWNQRCSRVVKRNLYLKTEEKWMSLIPLIGAEPNSVNSSHKP